MLIFILFLVCALAFANGANDVSRGIATLVGSGVARYRVAVAWGAIWTGIGALAAAWVAHGLLVRFSGKGFLDGFAAGPEFFAAAAGGAVLWVGLATKWGLPVSTTHAVTGALAGAGLAMAGAGELAWTSLGLAFLLPLAISPLLAAVLVLLSWPIFRRVTQTAGGYCLCVQRDPSALAATNNGFALARTEGLGESLVVGNAEQCGQDEVVSRFILLDAVHWVSAGAISLARGMNDAPKILALAWGAGAVAGIGETAGFGLIALAMTVGSLISGFRVTDTLANRITPLRPAEGFSANFVTACLVIGASRLGLPLSTTHVNGGALFGVGLRQNNGGLHWNVVRNILLSWAVTLPAAMALAAFLLMFMKVL